MENDSIAESREAPVVAGFAGDSGGLGSKASLARLSRKRTKTGCQTCRKRRIKCGEERPTCVNCNKSKRQCEGYSQRVVFKDPLSTYKGSVHATPNTNLSVNSASSAASTVAHRNANVAATAHAHSQTLLPTIAPKAYRDLHQESSMAKVSMQVLSQHVYEAPHRVDSSRGVETVTDIGATTGIISQATSNTDIPLDTIETSHIQFDTGPQSSLYDHMGPHDEATNISELNIESGVHHSDAQARSYYSNFTPHTSYQDGIPQFEKAENVPKLPKHAHRPSLEWQMNSGKEGPWHHLGNSHSQEIQMSSSQQPHTYANRPPECHGQAQHDAEKHIEHEHHLNHQDFPSLENSAGREAYPVSEKRELFDMQGVRNFALEVENFPGGSTYARRVSSDNELWDVSDEDINAEEYDHDPEANFGNLQYEHLENNDLGIVVALQAAQDRQEQRSRTYHSFLECYGPDMLSTYEPSARSSPLSDSETAKIFCHYINVTGPSISLYERHPVNPSLIFQGRPVPKTQHHIWSYTMPILALNNQALLHAMLAIGSLHMAFLRGIPAMASLKHYHIALRRVAKSVRLPTRRGQPATLAATLMLGWYELMSADHQKWSNHLLGAKQLIREIDFAGMTRFLKRRNKSHQQTRHANLYHHDMALGLVENPNEGQADFMDAQHDEDVNENIVSVIMGKKVQYDQYGHILENGRNGDHLRTYTPRELEIYETQRDLFWWYCKQDAFQSILSGNRLFMQYDLWSHCPPRAAIGKRDAVYGTFDHLILLLGRLTEFAAKDQKRKRWTMQSHGVHHRPSPPSSSSTNIGGSNECSRSMPPQMPKFAGMMPGTEGKATLPRGFSPTSEDSLPYEEDGASLEELTAKAGKEWADIRAAFSVVQDNFGPDFQPLGPQHSAPIQTPFGMALQYRTYGIAGIWITYYMGLILCHRYHPSMPPAATIAAGVAARQTAVFANEIGRIAAAIAPNASEIKHVQTGIGAALIDVTFGLFIAGVQYQDSAQRSWLVQRCYDIKRLTGWQTGRAIAMGCESAWVKTAEAGRGPPYHRTMEKVDDTVWYTARRRIDKVLSDRIDQEKLVVARVDRVHYALGLLGVEEDFEKLDFEGDEKFEEK